MYCESCKKEIENDLKICNNCGQPVIKKSNLNVEKIRKNLKNTGNSFYIIGLVTIFVNIGIYLWSILDKNFFEFGLPIPDLSGTFLTVVIASIFVIFGNRIKKAVDVKMKLYLKILLILLLVILVWIYFIGGQVGILFFFLIAYVILSLVLITKAMKVKEFTDTLTSPKYKIDKRAWVIFVIITVVLFFVAMKIDLSTNMVDKFLEREGADKTMQELINIVVKEIRSNVVLPVDIDEATTWTDITAQPNAIRYHLISSDVVMDDVSNELLRKNIKLNICQDEYLRSLLDSYINIEYLYVVEDTGQEYFISFTKEDCLK